MHLMSRQDRSAAAAHETIRLLRRVRTLAVQEALRRSAADGRSADLAGRTAAQAAAVLRGFSRTTRPAGGW